MTNKTNENKKRGTTEQKGKNKTQTIQKTKYKLKSNNK